MKHNSASARLHTLLVLPPSHGSSKSPPKARVHVAELKCPWAFPNIHIESSYSSLLVALGGTWDLAWDANQGIGESQAMSYNPRWGSDKVKSRYIRPYQTSPRIIWHCLTLPNSQCHIQGFMGHEQHCCNAPNHRCTSILHPLNYKHSSSHV